MLPKECMGIKRFHKCECGYIMNLSVLKTPAGYYLGFFCENCGPYSRETEYYKDREEAENDLKNNPSAKERS